MRGEANVDCQSPNVPLFVLYLRALEDPMGVSILILELSREKFSLGEHGLGDGPIFSCQICLIDEKITPKNKRVTRNFAIRNINIPRDQVHIHKLLQPPISEHSDLELLFCGLLDLIIAAPEENVVDGSGKPAEDDQQHSEDR